MLYKGKIVNLHISKIVRLDELQKEAGDMKIETVEKPEYPEIKSELFRAGNFWMEMLKQEFLRIKKSNNKHGAMTVENKKASDLINKRMIHLENEMKLVQNFKEFEI